MDKIILIGFAATGRSTVGALLADKLTTEFIDVDHEIESVAGKSVQRILEQDGEQYFRSLENHELSKLTSKAAVIACGGGSVLCDSFSQLAATGRVVWLQASADIIHRRLNGGRPLFDGLTVSQLNAFIQQRSVLYGTYADIAIATDEFTPEQVAAQLLNMLKKVCNKR